MQKLNQGEDLEKLTEEIVSEDIDLEEAENVMDSKTLQLGENNFRFSFVHCDFLFLFFQFINVFCQICLASQYVHKREIITLYTSQSKQSMKGN